MARPHLPLATVLLAALPTLAGAQGIVVDQGEFTVRIGGRTVGTETFVVRRAGMGREDAIFANGVATLRADTAQSEIRPLLRVLPPDGVAESYQVSVTGPDALEARIARSGRRYVATIRFTAGDEDREFQARSDTRIVDLGIAHHYYFLRDVREGRGVHVIEPRTRRQVVLSVASRSDEDLALGPNSVSARRVAFTSDGGDDRTVWYDRQGRVLRVEIPSLGYVAERTDLVG
jgi:hypothetical protein